MQVNIDTRNWFTNVANKETDNFSDKTDILKEKNCPVSGVFQ